MQWVQITKKKFVVISFPGKLGQAHMHILNVTSNYIIACFKKKLTLALVNSTKVNILYKTNSLTNLWDFNSVSGSL